VAKLQARAAAQQEHFHPWALVGQRLQGAGIEVTEAGAIPGLQQAAAANEQAGGVPGFVHFEPAGAVAGDQLQVIGAFGFEFHGAFLGDFLAIWRRCAPRLAWAGTLGAVLSCGQIMRFPAMHWAQWGC